jgi:zinc and cadmium transporter
MHLNWIYAVISVLVVSLVSLIGAVTLYIRIDKFKRYLSFLISFAAGALLGGVFIHLLPEIAQESGFTDQVSLLVLLGLLLFFVLEKLVCWRHCHIPTSKDHPHTLGIMNLIGDGLHNFTDGVIIASAFLSSTSLGLVTTVAVLLHEIPQEIGDFSVLIYAGFSRTKALFFNFLSALLALAGVIITILIGVRVEGFTQYLIPITAGGFIYIASSDLIPELKKEEGLQKSFFQFLSLLLGVVIMWLFKTYIA